MSTPKRKSRLKAAGADDDDVEMNDVVAEAAALTSNTAGMKRRRSDSSDGESNELDQTKRAKATEKHQTIEGESTSLGNNNDTTAYFAAASRPPLTATSGKVSSRGGHPTNVIATTRSVQPIVNLRPPSKHTPGKTRETANVPLDSASELPSVGKLSDSSRRVGLLLATPLKERPTSDESLVHEQAEEDLGLASKVDEEPMSKYASYSIHRTASDRESMDPFLSSLRRPATWFWIFFLLQTLSLQFFRAVLVSTSDHGNSFYKSFLSRTPSNSFNVSVAPHEIRILRQLMAELKSAATTLRHNKEYLASDISKSFHLPSGKLAPQVGSLGSSELPARIQMLEASNTRLSKLMEVGSTFNESSFLDRQKQDLIAVSMLDLWKIDDVESDSCGYTSIDLNDKTQFMSETQLGQSATVLKEYVQNKAKRLNNSNEEAIYAWIYDVTSTILGNDNGQIQDENLDSRLRSGNERLRSYLNSRLEVEYADRTGRVDYASIANGASVIRSGPAATSKSFSENVPYLNRLAHHVSLRFYGHGPEAALTPTHPVASLGQCWSFEKESNSLSGFGTLTVRLARPVFVEKISIEHPTVDFTDNQKSAIRSFRIIGFEDFEAQSQTRQTLGSFEFQISENASGLQTFNVLKCESVLKSISLAVDTIWGGPSACLYRFRVHGREG